MCTEKQIFEVNKDAMALAQKFLDSCYEKNGIRSDVSAKISVCSDEIVSNIVKYSGTCFFDVECSLINGLVSVTYSDNGIPFNPLTDSKEPDPLAPPEEREIGGLGIFMVKKMMDCVEYNRIDNRNVLKITISQN